MSNIYFCHVRDSFGQILSDDLCSFRVCMLSSLDFETLVFHGYSVEIIDLVDSSPRSYHSYCRRLSRRTVQYIINFNKLPNCKRL